MPDIIQQLLDLKEWSQDSARYERRLNFRYGSRGVLGSRGPGEQIQKEKKINEFFEARMKEDIDKAIKRSPEGVLTEQIYPDPDAKTLDRPSEPEIITEPYDPYDPDSRGWGRHPNAIEYDDGTIYYKNTGEWYLEDGTQVNGPSPGAKPIPKTLEAREGGRIGYDQGGQLVQPGPGRQGYQGNPRKLRVELTADQTVEFRKRVEKLATFNDQPKPNWKEHPNLGYDYDNITEHNMASDAKRNLLKGRKPQELKFLNKADQDLIKSKFTLPENVKEWNFKEYKYGLSQTTPKGENYKLGQSVRNYIVNKHHFNYGFSDFGNRNYHLFQMGRASKKYPKLYEPIYQNKKVIGFIDNTPTGKGEKYYHADYKKGKTILQHPDAEKLGDIRKVIEKANKNFAETADNIFSKHGYKNISEVMDDFQKIKGRSDIPSGIVQHHPFGSGEAGKTVLLTRDANMFAENVKGAVKSGKITLDQADRLLKEKGIPYEIEGKKLGKWDISPQKQLRDWEKGLERKFLSGKKTLQEFPETKNFKEFFTPESRLSGKKVMVASTLNKFLEANGVDICD